MSVWISLLPAWSVFIALTIPRVTVGFWEEAKLMRELDDGDPSTRLGYPMTKTGSPSLVLCVLPSLREGNERLCVSLILSMATSEVELELF